MKLKVQKTTILNGCLFLMLFLTLDSSYADKTARWANRVKECSRLRAEERDLQCGDVDFKDTTLLKESPKPENFLVTAEFGPSKCVVDDQLEEEKKTLRAECEQWTKERKADLGKDFVTSTCQPECTPCGNPPIFKHCTYKGQAHYRKEPSK